MLVRVPALHDLVPDKVYPSLHVGVHDDPCARVEVQPEPGAPLAMTPDASHGLGLHTAVSVRVPALHDLVPERVYPVLHVGVHDDPLSRTSPQGDINPFAIVPVEHLRVFVGL